MHLQLHKQPLSQLPSALQQKLMQAGPAHLSRTSPPRRSSWQPPCLVKAPAAGLLGRGGSSLLPLHALLLLRRGLPHMHTPKRSQLWHKHLLLLICCCSWTLQLMLLCLQQVHHQVRAVCGVNMHEALHLGCRQHMSISGCLADGWLLVWLLCCDYD